MIFITGDTHIPIDIHKLNTMNFQEQESMNPKRSYVIVCGDFGGVWDNSNEEKYWLKWLSEKSFTTLFVDGNHENFELLKEYPVIDYMGGKAQKIVENVYHLMRGKVYEIDGKSIFTMGGASSHDKEYRIEGISWWPEELPSAEEYETAMQNLEKHGWKVDYVITHCAPDSIQDKLCDHYKHDKLTNFLEVVIKEKLDYKHWYFGHYHVNRDVDEKHTCLYENIVTDLNQKLEREPKLLVNKIKCNHCGDTVISEHRHDFKWCKCETVAVDGGTDYTKRTFKHSPDDYTELSEYEE